MCLMTRAAMRVRRSKALGMEVSGKSCAEYNQGPQLSLQGLPWLKGEGRKKKTKLSLLIMKGNA